MDKITEIKSLTEELLRYCHEYYDLDSPTISDTEYDKKYDKLFRLENEANFWLANSPTRKVQGQVLDGFQKITHSKPMLSAAKTKDVGEIKKFIGNNEFYCSYKLDGLTLVCIYEGGKLKKAITRGTGLVGEDVTEQAKMIGNLPMTIPYDGYLELRGECVVSWDSFNKTNETLEDNDIEEIKENGWSLVPSKYIEFIDHDLDIDFNAEMRRIQHEMKDILTQEKQSQQMLEDAFRGIGYGID